MKKWVSLFIKEISAQKISISKEILDKALYLFSNIEDFELQVDNLIIENQKSYMMATYYYNAYMMQYCQMMRQNYASWKYNGLFTRKNIEENKQRKLRMMKKLSPNALEFSPVENARN